MIKKIRKLKQRWVEDYVGTKHEMLTIIGTDFIGGVKCAVAQCDCGTIKKMHMYNLRRIFSCGCAQRALKSAARKTHGHSRGPTYASWSGMIARCSNQKWTQWKDYGGRGITVCDRWRKFENFLADMGERPSRKHSLERMDVNGNYEPSNCKWATKLEQANNTRTNHFLELNGERLTIAQWARKLGVTPSRIHGRLKKGADVAVALDAKRYWL